MARIEELTRKAVDAKPTVKGSAIYGAWIKYAREYPENVFGEQTRAF
jgi:hypothetical protein